MPRYLLLDCTYLRLFSQTHLVPLAFLTRGALSSPHDHPPPIKFESLPTDMSLLQLDARTALDRVDDQAMYFCFANLPAALAVSPIPDLGGLP